MLDVLKHWQTTLAGVGTVATAFGHLATTLSTGDTSTVVVDVMAIMAGIGLIRAKDIGKS